ncbi:MAG: hypothetical protein LBQ77_03790 [Treponema sp.]|nr:hypothetical protein [Treponema sp.]
MGTSFSGDRPSWGTDLLEDRLSFGDRLLRARPHYLNWVFSLKVQQCCT